MRSTTLAYCQFSRLGGYFVWERSSGGPQRDRRCALRGIRWRDDDQDRVCEHCGAAGALAELRVYTRAPGIVARCPSCGSVVLVLVDAGRGLPVHLALQLLDSGETEGPRSRLPGS